MRRIRARDWPTTGGRMMEEFLHALRLLYDKPDVSKEAISILMLSGFFAFVFLTIVLAMAFSLLLALVNQPTQVAVAISSAFTSKASYAAMTAQAVASTAQLAALTERMTASPSQYSPPVKYAASDRPAVPFTVSDGKLVIGLPGTKYDLSEGFVYVIKGQGGSHFKIGKAKNIQERLKQLSAGSQTKLELVHAISSNAANVAERYLHNHFAAQRGHGEWFDLTEAHLKYIKAIGRMDILEHAPAQQPDPSGTPRTPQAHPSTNGATSPNTP